jgi:hypothetical protein
VLVILDLQEGLYNLARDWGTQRDPLEKPLQQPLTFKL